MANANTEIDLAQLHFAIENAIKAQFPAFKIVEFYREEDNREPPTPEQLPACLLELEEMDGALDIDPGTEQLAVRARFKARVIIGFRTPRAKIEVRKLAGALAAWMHKNRRFHGQPTGPLEIISLQPDEFDDRLDRFEVWAVEWVMVLHLGETVWKDDGVTPDAPVYSWLPDIGDGNADKYQDAVPPPMGGIAP